MQRRVWISAVLFVTGLIVFAAGAGFWSEVVALCSYASATSFGHALGAACGGVSRTAGLLLLVLAAAMLWCSTRLDRLVRDG